MTKTAIWVNLVEVWENNIIDAIDYYDGFIDFSVVSREELKEECLNLIQYYFDNEMLGNEINYRNIVIDIASEMGAYKDE